MSIIVDFLHFFFFSVKAILFSYHVIMPRILLYSTKNNSTLKKKKKSSSCPFTFNDTGADVMPLNFSVLFLPLTPRSALRAFVSIANLNVSLLHFFFFWRRKRKDIMQGSNSGICLRCFFVPHKSRRNPPFFVGCDSRRMTHHI